MKCSVCGKNYSLFHYFYIDTTGKEFPTCQNCEKPKRRYYDS